MITFRFYTVQIRKLFELYEQLRQRMGVVIVGPSGSGKSTIWKLLRQTLIKSGQQVNIYVMNPKSMPRTRVIFCVCITILYFVISYSVIWIWIRENGPMVC
jgi:ABC-type nitrate/sulfonate/bicarbonate transport system ATPase subunit